MITVDELAEKDNTVHATYESYSLVVAVRKAFFSALSIISGIY